MTRIAIVGAGAIGGWIAGRMAIAGQQVTLFARGPTLASLAEGGLRIEESGRIDRAEPALSDDPARAGAHDVVLIAVKAPALADAADWAGPLIGPETLVVPLVNGVPFWLASGEPLESIDPGGRIARALPPGRLIGSVVHAACSRAAPNHVRVAHSDRLILGEPGGGFSERVESLCRLIRDAEIPCEASDAIARSAWYKLWGNATINPLSALTRSTADRLIADPVLHRFMLAAMAELARIGAAVGCPIDESGEQRMEVTARLGAFKPSMLQDVEAERPIELEALVGAPIELARRHGLETPALDLIYSATRLLARSSGLA